MTTGNPGTKRAFGALLLDFRKGGSKKPVDFVAIEAHVSQWDSQVFRPLGDDLKSAVVDGMVERDGPRVESHSLEPVALAKRAIEPSRAIIRVVDQWVVKVRHMSTNLMKPAGLRAHSNDARVPWFGFSRRDQSPVAERVDSRAVLTSWHGMIDDSSGELRHTSDQRSVDFLDRFTELGLELSGDLG